MRTPHADYWFSGIASVEGAEPKGAAREHRGVEVEERRRRALLVEVVVCVRGARHARSGNRHSRRRRIGHRPVRGRDAARVDVVRQILAGVADDPQSIGGGIEVDAEVGAARVSRPVLEPIVARMSSAS
jgi:hypothetical protein